MDLRANKSFVFLRLVSITPRLQSSEISRAGDVRIREWIECDGWLGGLYSWQMDEKWKVVGAEKTISLMVMITSGWADTWHTLVGEKKRKTPYDSLTTSAKTPALLCKTVAFKQDICCTYVFLHLRQLSPRCENTIIISLKYQKDTTAASWKEGPPPHTQCSSNQLSWECVSAVRITTKAALADFQYLK